MHKEKNTDDVKKKKIYQQINDDKIREKRRKTRHRERERRSKRKKETEE